MVRQQRPISAPARLENVDAGELRESREVVSLSASSGWRRFDLTELWRYRELVLFLAWRDISVRYKQTVLGVFWALLQPLLLMAVFTMIFSLIARMPTGGTPYPLFVFAGLLPWQLFAYALTEASVSIVGNERLITKVYFPRVLVPAASVFSGLADFLVGLALLAVLILVFGITPGPLWALPGFIALALASALGVGLWLAAVNVQFRDVRFTLPFLTQVWMLATPIVYPSAVLPEPLRSLIGLNPMTGVVEGFRWATVGGVAPNAGQLAISAVAAGVVLVTGFAYFRRMEHTFADVI